MRILELGPAQRSLRFLARGRAAVGNAGTNSKEDLILQSASPNAGAGTIDRRAVGPVKIAVRKAPSVELVQEMVLGFQAMIK
jgi:hypothetical protein